VIETLVLVTDEVGPGTVAVPHGWGHAGGSWERANKAGGANVNQLASTAHADIERVAGMSHLNGIAVRLESLDVPTGVATGVATDVGSVG
jgi:formate dehydrogenase